jgi:hypothetical protein
MMAAGWKIKQIAHRRLRQITACHVPSEERRLQVLEQDQGGDAATCIQLKAVTRLMRHKEIAATSLANSNNKTDAQEQDVHIAENRGGDEVITYPAEQAGKDEMISYLAADEDDKEIKGTKMRLKLKVASMDHKRFHSSRGHPATPAKDIPTMGDYKSLRISLQTT